MEVKSLNLRYGSYLMELTPSKLPSGPYTMEGTSWNLHHRIVAIGSYTMEVTSWNLHHGSYQVELTSWKLPQ